MRLSDLHRNLSSRWGQLRYEVSQRVAPFPDQAHSSFEEVVNRLAHLAFGRFRLFTNVLVSLIALALFIAVWRTVYHFVQPNDAEERTNLITTFAQAIGGLILVLGVFFTAKTYLVNREGQITERFSRAIEHLASESLSTRLGGIYALERIARDSSRDQKQVIEILSAFVRENAATSTPRSEGWQAIANGDALPGSLVDPWMPDGQKIKPDIQAIITVLGRRERGPERAEPTGLDLEGTDLRKASWSDAYLPHSILIYCDLEGAWVKGADLSAGLLNGANLRKATFASATLKNAWIQHAVVIGAHFTEVEFEGANVYGTKFQWSHFRGAKMKRIGFHDCDLDNASFAQADLTLANFTSASLDRTDFTDANLTHANFRGADLSTCRGLTLSQIRSSQTDETTILPASLKEELEGESRQLVQHGEKPQVDA